MDNKLTIISEGDLKEIIKETLQGSFLELFNKAKDEYSNNRWLSKKELIELTGWSPRTIQYLRDTKQIPYSQHGKKILYPYKGIVQFLERNMVKANQIGKS